MLRLIVAACLLALSAGAQEPSPSDFEIEAAYCLGADSVLLRMINPGQMDCGNGAPKSCTEMRDALARAHSRIDSEAGKTSSLRPSEV